MTINAQMVFGFKRVRFDEPDEGTTLVQLQAYESARLKAQMERDIRGCAGQAAQPINCVNCGAPRVATRGTCDYCGSES